MLLFWSLGHRLRLGAHDDVVDGNVYQLDEEADEAHDAEANGGGDGNLLELLAVGLGAALHQADRVLGEGASRLGELNNLVHDLVERVELAGMRGDWLSVKGHFHATD